MVLLAPMDSRADDVSVDEGASFGRANTLRPEPCRLSALEQSVVALSLFDAVSTVRAPGFVQRFLSGAFGIEPANKLADKRLEILRRYCILSRAGASDPEACEREAMRTSGFSEEKICEIDRLIVRASLDRQLRAAADRERV